MRGREEAKRTTGHGGPRARETEGACSAMGEVRVPSGDAKRQVARTGSTARATLRGGGQGLFPGR